VHRAIPVSIPGSISIPVSIPAAAAIQVSVSIRTQTSRTDVFPIDQTTKILKSITGQHQKLIRQIDSKHYNFANILRLDFIKRFLEAFSLVKFQPCQVKLKNHFSSDSLDNNSGDSPVTSGFNNGSDSNTDNNSTEDSSKNVFGFSFGSESK